ncbi:MAG: hypothetical protein A2600_04805 [Candidatus Lambdaproteobacteria bacterium RIFOXYD1_FULL_56_27]|uniref:Uncharacterized protein n=1 Tax=Candidatus Lambdaproteobacteria bacterium RIFOXYD2_FULL_56_26 TaxID=1817773 RepID=A0A1F6H3Y8_9PROT|nr:MAG: hypothetical protein A2426_13870 [Candidatus Lambdaproteobacteria bacterium RIFOXYC1_FULL_56_13]OGH05073.1 MAG: hypothetical protein A2557_08870 [Candidatus Lambdaproteobacteria bacterium RIFOXYD2_FULL_56_26]OGH09538.1 MAG: hypothetical protein A2600_04805 [Candidatus Lambdaproteobacteria bacterium RIFOXYD1_FULL_56_27]
MAKKGDKKPDLLERGSLDCQRAIEPKVPLPGASAQELQILCRSFAKCLVEKGHGYRQLMEAACHLLDQAMEELSAETEEVEEKPAVAVPKPARAKYNTAVPPQA